VWLILNYDVNRCDLFQSKMYTDLIDLKLWCKPGVIDFKVWCKKIKLTIFDIIHEELSNAVQGA